MTLDPALPEITALQSNACLYRKRFLLTVYCLKLV